MSMMVRIDACDHINKMTEAEYRKLVHRHKTYVPWRGRKVRMQRRRSVHVLLRDNPIKQIREDLNGKITLQMRMAIK